MRSRLWIILALLALAPILAQARVAAPFHPGFAVAQAADVLPAGVQPADTCVLPDGTNICDPTSATPPPSATPDPTNSAISGLLGNAQKNLETPCTGQPNVITQFIDDIFDIVTFQKPGQGLFQLAGREVDLGVLILLTAFGYSLIKFGMEISKQDLNQQIISTALKVAGLVGGIVLINTAGGFYFQPTGHVVQGAPFTTQAVSAGATLGNRLMQPVLDSVQQQVDPNGKPIVMPVPPTRPGAELGYTTCISAKIVAFSFISGFKTIQDDGKSGVWFVGDQIDLLAALILAIIYLILTLPAALAMFAAGLFMANHWFVLGVNANLLGVVAIFTIGFIGHEFTKQWGTAFFSLCYSIFTTSLVLTVVNVIMVAGAAVIEHELITPDGSINIIGVAFKLFAMGAFILSLAIRGPKLAGVFAGKMGYDTADAIEGLAATAGLAALAAKGASMAVKAAAKSMSSSKDRSISGSKSTSSGDAKAPGADKPTPGSDDPSSSRSNPKAGEASPAAKKTAPKTPAGDAARSSRAGQTLGKRLDQAKNGATSDEKNKRAASALSNFAAAMNHQSATARTAGDDRLAQNSSALAGAAEELASAAGSMDPQALHDAGKGLANAAETAHLVPPTEALQGAASALAGVGSSDAQQAAQNLTAAATGTGAFNAGRALSNASRATATGGKAAGKALTGSPLGRAISTAQNTALNAANSTSTAGRVAGVVADSLGHIANAPSISSRAATALTALGETLSNAIESHASSEGASIMLHSAAQQLGAAAAEPDIDPSTRSAYIQAAAVTSAGAMSLGGGTATGGSPIGTGISAARPAAQALQASTTDQGAQIHAAAASSAWLGHSAAETAVNDAPRAYAAQRIAAAFGAMGLVGAPRNDLERQAYALIYSASNALESGSIAPQEVAGMLSVSEAMLRSSSQQTEANSVRGLHLDSAAGAVNGAADALGGLQQTVTSDIDGTPAFAHTAQQGGSSGDPSSEQYGPGTSPRNPDRTPAQRNEFTNLVRRMFTHHSRTDHTHFNPPNM